MPLPRSEPADLAVRAAQAAGRELLVRWGKRQVVHAKSSATDPVTEADRASEALLERSILAERPADAIIGEEGADHAGSSGLRWVIDPLDGTVNYLYGLPGWCVSVACEDPEGVLAGVVHDPVQRETYVAVRGEGAWLAGRRLRVNDPVPLGAALIATGFAYRAEIRSAQARRVARVLPAARDIRRRGSAALDLCAVAAGRVDGYYEDHLSAWDWAAGTLIVQEAGANVERIGDLLVAAGPSLIRPLRELVVRDEEED